MSTSPEQASNLELLSIAEADAYIHAANRAFSEGAVDVPCVKHNISGPGQLEVRKYENPDVQTNPELLKHIVWFETEAKQQSRVHETKIAQSIMNVGLDGKPYVEKTQVTRAIHLGNDQPVYSFSRKHDKARYKKTVRTPEECRKAEILFITMTSDFKALLSDKLADKPEVLDRIEAHARNMPVDPSNQLRYSGILGRMMLRKR